MLPENFASLKEFWAFWDTYSSADYEDLMEPVEVKNEEFMAYLDELFKQEATIPFEDVEKELGL